MKNRKTTSKYYSTQTAIKKLKERKISCLDQHIADLKLPDGATNAERLQKGGKHDGYIVLPWILSDLFSI